MSDGLTARLYISDLGKRSFKGLVGEMLGVEFGASVAASFGPFGIDAEQNPDYDYSTGQERSRSPEFPDWLFYRWTIWIEPETADAKLDDFIALVARLAAGF